MITERVSRLEWFPTCLAGEGETLYVSLYVTPEVSRYFPEVLATDSTGGCSVIILLNVFVDLCLKFSLRPLHSQSFWFYFSLVFIPFFMINSSIAILQRILLPFFLDTNSRSRLIIEVFFTRLDQTFELKSPGHLQEPVQLLLVDLNLSLVDVVQDKLELPRGDSVKTEERMGVFVVSEDMFEVRTGG